MECDGGPVIGDLLGGCGYVGAMSVDGGVEVA